LDDAEVPSGLPRGVLPRLESFPQPFVRSLASAEQRASARRYIQGLLSDLKSKDAEGIAYLHDRERQGLQKFLGQAAWDHRPLPDELARQLASTPARHVAPSGGAKARRVAHRRRAGTRATNSRVKSRCEFTNELIGDSYLSPVSGHSDCMT